jgi:son of sevenless-like protein
MNNFQSVMQIMSALESTPIGRLKKCWQVFRGVFEGIYEQDVGKTSAMYSELKEQMKTEKNYKQYRKTLSTVNGPCLPFLGTLLIKIFSLFRNLFK